MTPRGFTTPVVASIALGLAGGMACHHYGTSMPILSIAAEFCGVAAGLFLRLIQLLVGPMVFVTIVAGLGGLPHGTLLHRAGLRAAVWFTICSLGAVVAGGAVAVLLPGLASPGQFASTGAVLVPPDTIPGLLTLLVPRGLLEALTTGETVPVAAIAVAVGIVLHASRPVLSNTLVKAAEEFVIVMLGLVRLIMRLAPAAAFAATVAITAVHGLDVLAVYGAFVAGSVTGLALVAALLCGGGFLVLGRHTGPLLRRLQAPVAVGFATASSEAAVPRLMEELDAHGVSHRLSGVVLPLAYAFNLCGSVAYQAFAVLFLAQVYGVPLALPGVIWALALVFVLSKGMAGLPRASTVVLAAVLPALGIPAEAMLLVLGIDGFIDMARTAVNVLGNGLATAGIAQWAAPRPASCPAPGFAAGRPSR